MLEFEPKGHQYKWNGLKVPGVTKVIREFAPFRYGNDTVRDFGIALHETISLNDSGQLDDYDPQLRPWMIAWERFKSDNVPSLRGYLIVDIKTGQPTVSWDLQIAAYRRLFEEKQRSGEPFTEFPLNEVLMYSERYGYGGRVDRIFKGESGRQVYHMAVILRSDSTYKPHIPETPVEADFNTFLSLLNTWRWMEKHNLLTKETE